MKILGVEMNWSSVKEKATVSIITAVATSVILWGANLGGGFVTYIFLPELPGAAVVAFDGECPDGWVSFEASAGRFIVAAGRNRDQNGEVRNFEVGIGDDDGQYRHRLVASEVPRHSHSGSYVVTDVPGNNKGGNHQVMVVYSESYGVLEDSVGKSGGVKDEENIPHNNLPPYIALSLCKKK